MKQDMRAEFEEWRLGGTLVSTTNPYKELTQPCQFWSFEAWQHRQQELDAARRDVDALRQRSLVNSRVADGRLKEIERLRGALQSINDFRSNDNDDFAEFACKTAEQALAAQQEKG